MGEKEKIFGHRCAECTRYNYGELKRPSKYYLTDRALCAAARTRAIRLFSASRALRPRARARAFHPTLDRIVGGFARIYRERNSSVDRLPRARINIYAINYSHTQNSGGIFARVNMRYAEIYRGVSPIRLSNTANKVSGNDRKSR